MLPVTRFTTPTSQSTNQGKRKAEAGFDEPSSKDVCTEERSPVPPDPLSRIDDLLMLQIPEEPMRKNIWALANEFDGVAMPADTRDAFITKILATVADEKHMGYMVHELALVLGGPVMSEANCNALIAHIAHAQCSPEHVAEIVGALCKGLGGVLMREETRNCLLNQILGPGVDQVKMRRMVFSLAASLGGKDMPEVVRNGLIRLVLDKQPRHDEPRLDTFFIGFGEALGGQDMLETNRNALLTQILDAHQNFSPNQMDAMIHGLSFALGNRTMSNKNCGALLAAILDRHQSLTRDKTMHMIIGLFCVLGGPTMSVVNRNALLTEIFDRDGGLACGQMMDLIHGLSRALGGPAMTKENREALLSAILEFDFDHLTEMIYALSVALGARNMSEENRNALAVSVFSIHEACSPQQMERMTECIANALGGSDMTSDNRAALLEQAFSRPASFESTQSLVIGLGKGLGRTKISDCSRDALIEKVLSLHGRFDNSQMACLADSLFHAIGGGATPPEKRRALLSSVLGSYADCPEGKMGAIVAWLAIDMELKAEEVVTAILRAGAEPFASGAMIARYVSTHRPANIGQLQVLESKFNKWLADFAESDPVRAQVLTPFARAAFYTGFDDIRALLQAPELSDRDKRRLLQFAFDNWLKPDPDRLTRVIESVLQTEAIAPALKSEALLLLLKKNEFSGKNFNSVRDWHLRHLATLAPDSEDVADWYIAFHSLYNECRQYMSEGFLQQQREFLTDHQNFPGDSQKTRQSILTLL